jgi:predicted phage terminase large subunit-like protein
MIIIDDPMKPQEAMSDTARNNVKQWYDSTLYSRLDNKKEDTIILVMQRLHIDDLVSHVIEKESWVHLDLPSIAEVDQTFELSSGQIYTRSKGDAFHPEREPIEVLDTTRNTIGSMAFSAQYQQRPVPQEGSLVRWSWFQRYDELPAKQSNDKIIQSWDTASTTTEMSDYSVCTTWHIHNENWYLIDIFRKKLEYPDLVRAVISQSNKFDARPVLIEDTSSGVALIQQLRRDSTGLSIVKVKPDKDKVTRMNNASIDIEAGKVFLPQKAPWLEDFQKEILAFPAGAHDDQVDSLSQALNWNRRRNTMHVGVLCGF